MLKLFRNLQRSQPRLATKRDEAFLELLFRVLRELANPTPPSHFATRVQHHSYAHPERSLPMNAPAGTNDPTLNSNLLLFAPLNPSGAPGMSRSSVAVAVLCNLALLFLAVRQVHNQIIADKPHIMTLLAPVEKLPEPVRPRLTPKVLPTPTPTLRPNTPAIVRTATVAPAPPTPASVPYHASALIPISQPSVPRIAPAPVAPAVHAVALSTSAVAIQPTGPAVATINLSRSATSPSAGTPGATTVTLGTPHGPSGPPSAGSAGPVRLGGCNGCQPGDTHVNGVAHFENVPFPVPSDPPARPTPAVAHTPAGSAPTVVFKPRPAYTSEAAAQHIEGQVRVKIRVAADGTVTVLGVLSGLGHGLDESAAQCAEGIRFKPATDASGKPTDWEGVVYIGFQMS